MQSFLIKFCQPNGDRTPRIFNFITRIFFPVVVALIKFLIYRFLIFRVENLVVAMFIMWLNLLIAIKRYFLDELEFTKFNRRNLIKMPSQASLRLRDCPQEARDFSNFNHRNLIKIASQDFFLNHLKIDAKRFFPD